MTPASPDDICTHGLKITDCPNPDCTIMKALVAGNAPISRCVVDRRDPRQPCVHRGYPMPLRPLNFDLTSATNPF